MSEQVPAAPAGAPGARALADAHPASAACAYLQVDRRRAVPAGRRRQPDPRGRHPGRPRADPRRRGRPWSRTAPRSWSSVDRNALADQKDEGAAVLRRLAATLGPTSRDRRHGRAHAVRHQGAAKPPVCWNGSPYQPIPVAKDVATEVALSIMERREHYPGVTAELEAVREYPSPEGANAAHVLGYLGPVTDAELKATEGSTGDPSCARPTSSGGPASRPATTSYLRGAARACGRWPSTTPAPSRARSTTTDATAGNYLVTSIDAKVQAVAEQALEEQIKAARAGKTYNCERRLQGRLGRGRSSWTSRPVASWRWRATRPTTPTSGSAGSRRSSTTALTEPEGEHALADRARGPASTRRRRRSRWSRPRRRPRPATASTRQLRLPGDYEIGNTTKSNFESEAYGDDLAQARPRGLVQHGLLPARLRRVAARRRLDPKSRRANE